MKDIIKKAIASSRIQILFFFILFVKGLAFNIETESIIRHKNPAFYFFYLGVWFSFISIYIAPSYLFNEKGQKIYLIGLNFLVSFALVADLLYYRAFSDFLSLFLIKQGGNVEGIWSSIFAMLRPRESLYVIDLLVLVPFLLKFKFGLERNLRLSAVLVVVSILYLSFVNLALQKVRDRSLFHVVWSPNEMLYNLSPYGYRIFDGLDYLFEDPPPEIDDAMRARVKSAYEANWESSSKPYTFGNHEGRNLIIIQVESLEAFAILAEIEGQEVTPNLNKLLHDSYFFPTIVEQTNLGGSSDMDLMLNTSLLPIRKGSAFVRFPQNTYRSLPKALASLGYQSFAVKVDKPNYYNWAPSLTSIGYDRCYSQNDLKMDEIFPTGLSDASMLRQSLDIIRGMEEPYLAFLTTMSSHSPFEIPEQVQRLKIEGPVKGTVLEDYLQAIHYADRSIGDFVSQLDSEGRLDNTIIMIYGDHTGLNKFFPAEIRAIEPRQSWCIQEIPRTSALFYIKGSEGKRMDVTGGQIDLMPTVLQLLGYDLELLKYSAMGRSLFQTERDFSYLANGDCIGSFQQSDEDQAKEMIELSDLLIRSSFFGRHK
ncbi:LTA synthase family protein [Haloferula sp.]|uniref:LTA synthase family protein n=1 Tax=Haloferula sp. TaxID=2497595 RepID=UPI003C737DD2